MYISQPGSSKIDGQLSRVHAASYHAIDPLPRATRHIITRSPGSRCGVNASKTSCIAQALKILFATSQAETTNHGLQTEDHRRRQGHHRGRWAHLETVTHSLRIGYVVSRQCSLLQSLSCDTYANKCKSPFSSFCGDLPMGF